MHRRKNTWESEEDPDAWKGDESESAAACYVCGKPALVGMTTDKGPACKRHLLGHMDIPVSEDEVERSCQECGRILRDPSDAAYLEKIGFFHPRCLKEEVKRTGKCPKCGSGLNSWGDCSSCWGGIAKWIEQAMNDARAVLGSEGRRLCAMCLRHNRSIGPGYPFYPVTPQEATKTCSECFVAVCDEHAVHLPEKNVLGRSTKDVYCGGLGFGPGTTTCIGKLESSLECSVEGCRASEERDYDALTEAMQCKKCDNWLCGTEHDNCPDCDGVKCEDCGKLTPKDELLRFEEDAYTIRELCETCLSEAETEEQESSWGNWLESDYKDGLESRFSDEGLELDLSGVDDLKPLFDEAMERCLVYWEGTEIDWRAVVMCTPVSSILALKGATLNGVPTSPNMALSRRVSSALSRVEADTAADSWGGRRRARAGRQEKPRRSLAATRSGRASLRESLRQTIRKAGGLWATPEQRRVIKKIPKTVAGMQTLIGMADRPKDWDKIEHQRRSELRQAARRERNPRRLDEERLGKNR